MKPCPFCGSSEINQHYPDEYGLHVCWCGNCGAFGPNDITADKALEMWNLRRPEAALLEALTVIKRNAQSELDADTCPPEFVLGVIEAAAIEALAAARQEEASR